ncbi:MAG: hypothetical protein M3P18_19820 [Actinomycetota bacterium]|nr:hypothetical protein [Actinomycetota bacterium]
MRLLHSQGAVRGDTRRPDGITIPILRNQMDHGNGYYGDRKIRLKLVQNDEDAYFAATGFTAAWGRDVDPRHSPRAEN